MLHIFSGKPRKNSVSSWLRKLSKRYNVAVEVEMFDIQVRPFLDLTQKSVQQKLLNKISSRRYCAVLFSPPCSTFSRAVWANRRGPRPVRWFVRPRGHGYLGQNANVQLGATRCQTLHIRHFNCRWIKVVWLCLRIQKNWGLLRAASIEEFVQQACGNGILFKRCCSNNLWRRSHFINRILEQNI